MKNSGYPDDLNDKEWELIKELAEKKNVNSGRPPKYPKRTMLNAIFYFLR